jgi:glycosyltransferase involved in cell wall biosynthesis
LRVLHVTPYYEDAWAYGGIPRVASSLARGLALRGHAVTVATTDARDATSRVAGPRARTSAGVEVRVFPNLSNAAAYHLQFFTPRGLGPWLVAHAREFDVAHLHACHNLPGALAGRRLGRAGVPYVLSPHGTAPRLERRRLAKWVFDTTLGRRLLPDAARVLAVTEAERRQLEGLGVAPARIRVIPNPVDVSEFADAPVPGGFRRRVGLEAPGKLVLFLGKLTPRKRVDVLVEAFATLGRPDAALVIAGNDLGAGRSARRLVRRRGLESRTVFTGLLSGADRLAALADADVVVYPSRDEIFGLVPLEALLAGTPVIVADDSGCGEVIAGTGGGRVLPQGDPRALAEALGAMLDEPGRWRHAAAAAQARVRARFAGDLVCVEVERLYEEVVHGRGG